MTLRTAAIAGSLLVALSAAQQALAVFPEDVDNFDRDEEVLMQNEPTSTSTLEEEETIEPLHIENTGLMLTRAEFTALIVEKLYTQSSLERCYWDIASSVPPRFTLVFTDVHINDQYAKHICVAMRDGLVDGYGDGSFRPNAKINLAESSKILSRAFSLAPYAEANRLGPWYEQYVRSVSIRNAIPTSFTKFDQPVSGAEGLDMIHRILNRETWKPSRRYEELMPKPVRRQVEEIRKKPSTNNTPSPAASSSQSSKSSSSSSEKRSFWNPF